MNSKEKALRIASQALEKQAESIEIIHVEEKVHYTSYLVVCSGKNERHVDALATAIETNMKEVDQTPLGIEGKLSNTWILMDFDDVVVHIFERDRRSFYDIETLWMDAKRISLESAKAPPKST